MPARSVLAPEMTDVELEVTKAYPNDSGRGIARLDPDTMGDLALSPGEVIEVEGGDATAAKVWRADREDWNTRSIRIDGFTRQNADVGIGERVTIRKAEVERADRLVLAPPEEASVQFDSDATGMIKRQILKRPIVERDIVPVMSSTHHPFMRSPGQAIPLIALETDPDGVVLVTEDTSVELEDTGLPRQTSLPDAARPSNSSDSSDSSDSTPLLRVNRTTVPEGLDLDELNATTEGIDVEGTDAAETDRQQVIVTGTIENVGETSYERVEASVTFFENDVGTIHLDRRVTETRAFAPGHSWKFAVSYRPQAELIPRSYDLTVRTAE